MLVEVHLLPASAACPALAGVCEVRRTALSQAGWSEATADIEKVGQAGQEKKIV